MPVGNEYGIKRYHIIPARRKWAGAGAYVGLKPLNNLKTMVIRHKHLLNAMLSIVLKTIPPISSCFLGPCILAFGSNCLGLKGNSCTKEIKGAGAGSRNVNKLLSKR